MTATSRSTLTRHARRLGATAAVFGALSMAATSTLAFAEGSRPAEAAAVASVVGLRQGDSGATVQAVQQKLIDLGYYVAEGANGTFGAGTAAALRVFQQQNGLNPTGVVTENTARYLGLAAGVPVGGAAAAQGLAAPAAATVAAAPGSVVGLRQGATGESVRQVQLAILATGLVLGGGADGTFGRSTHRGVTLVQRVNGLPETGVVDAATAAVLGLAGSASSPSTPAPAGAVVQLGARGASVQRIQQLLIKAGINVIGGADGVFGPQTRRSVSAFQGLHGLAQSGTVDAATDAALVKAAGGTTAAPTTPAKSYVGLRVGSTGAAVTRLQQAIMATGLVVRGGADGIFGQHTRTAVLIYQRVNGLPQTGIVDEATARLLGLTSATPSPAAPTGGGATATGFASYDERGARVVALPEGADQRRNQLHRRIRRHLRIGDRRSDHEVPTSTRASCHRKARSSDSECAGLAGDDGSGAGPTGQRRPANGSARQRTVLVRRHVAGVARQRTSPPGSRHRRPGWNAAAGGGRWADQRRSTATAPDPCRAMV